MESSEAGTSTNNQFGEEYQVFLSFRGCDTRHGFTNSFYHALVDIGIRVFIDDEELRPGEEISGELLRAIDDSKLYMPIFSKNYASSHWCLRELEKMVQNTNKSKNNGKKIILPIFYDVTPDDVKLKTPLFNKAISNLEQRMEDHKNKFNSEDLEMWRKALKEVDGTKGWELEKYSGDGDLIKTVVNEVVVRLKTRQKQVTKDLVGMEDQIAAINNLLDIDSGGVRLIGIYGMGGIGKTTLAKIIFNQLCSHFGKNCSFLDEVRETAKTKGLVKLQEQLLSNISHSRWVRNIDNVDHGITMFGQMICNKKMLIVLDDVDEGNQIQTLIGVNSLYLGTRVLVTTRDKNVLNIKGFKYDILSYEMEGLSQKDALKLFSMHAFDDSSPPVNYQTLSKDIVSTTNGLPLAIEAIGSSLFGQENKEIWKERLERLRKTPHKDVLGKLRISFDVLEQDQQQIFLDVACFFIGCHKTRPMNMWKHCGFSPEDAIDVLIKRCMIKVSDNGRFGMHDQLRDLGKAIAKDECTRLWDIDDIICQMQSTEIKESVHAIHVPRCVPNAPPITVTLEQINRFPRLRYLSLRGTFKGNFTCGLSNLKWINLPCSRCLESPNMSHLENLVQLTLGGIEITKDGVESLIKGARKLKVLILDSIRSLRGTPTFPEYSVLEKLSVVRCPFEEIDCSIGKLRCLTHLKIIRCDVVRKLPKQIGELQNLRHLSLCFCGNFTELPDSFTKLVSLTELDVSHTNITRLPNFVGRLSKLSTVKVSRSPIAEMPSTMSKLLHLQTLSLDNCYRIKELQELPRSLTSLRLRSTALLTVPNLSNLTNLVDLLLSDGSEHRDRSNATQTCDLQWIGRLSKLRKLHFCFPKIRAPTTELSSLSMLKELTLYGKDLPTFEQLPSNLALLMLRSTQAKEGIFHQIFQLVEGDARVGYYQSLSVPSAIRLSLRRLKEAKLYRHHEPLKVQLLNAIKLLERSCSQDHKSSGKLLCSLEETRSNELQAAQLTDRWRGATLFPSSLKMLQHILLHSCPEVQDIQFVSPLESLREFIVKECISLKRLGGLSNLKNLKQLHIDLCESLLVVEGIDELECLQRLVIWACISMESVFHASSSKIPNECQVAIRCSGKLLDTGPHYRYVNWESYRETILNGTGQALYFEIETTDSDTETRDSIQKTEQEDREEKREQDRVGKTTRKKKEGLISIKRLGAFAVQKIKALKNIF